MAKLVRISEAASLGLHTMAMLAREGQNRLTTQEVAARLCASGHHLAKVMQRLARAGLVSATRGPQGGFQLLKSAEDIRLLEIYEAIEGPLIPNGCLLSRPACDCTRDCALGDIVRKVHHLVQRHLSDTTLAELAAGAAFLGR
jgi:Rrf2 family protein